MDSLELDDVAGKVDEVSERVVHPKKQKIYREKEEGQVASCRKIKTQQI